MAYIVDTLIQNTGETDVDFNTRVLTYISDQYYYFVSVGGQLPLGTLSEGHGDYKGYPPIQATSDINFWDVTAVQMKRIVTFSYDNKYYYIFLGIVPVIPPPSPLPTAGTIAMFGPMGTLSSTLFAVDTALLTVDFAAYQLKDLANGVDPQDAVTMSQLAGAVGITSVNGDIGPAVTLTVSNSGTAGTLQWSGVQLQIPQADTDTTGLLSDTDWDTFNNKQVAGNYITDLTGDVTASGAGSVAATISNNAVTFAKMQNLTGPGILMGRFSALAGDPEEITLGPGLSMSGLGVLSAAGGSGTVTSVGLALPVEFSISGSPVIAAGTLTGSWSNQTNNLVFAGPAVAPAGTPTFRSLVAADIPSLSGIYQPLDTDLTAIAALVSAADKLPYATGAGTWSLTDLTAFARTILDDANAAAVIATLELGAIYQPLDSDLTDIAALAPSNDDIIQRKAGAWVNRTVAQYAADLTILAGTPTGSKFLRDDWTWQTVSASVAWGAITGTLSAQLDLQAALDAKVDENIAIAGATKTKITYDAKGLVTAGADATTADVNDSLNRRYVTDAQLVVIGNTSGTNTGDQTTIVGITGTLAEFNTALTGADFATGGGTVTGASSGTNTGDQTSIVGISGTKAQYDTSCSDGNFLYVGDITQYTDEMAQDAVGAMIDSTLVYVDATPLLTRAALTGDVTAPQASNTTTIANDVVTYAKIQNISVTQRVLGRNAAGAGDAEELTLTQLLDWVGSAAQGDILYRGAASWTRLAAGTSGQYLKTLGAGANPAWDTPAGGSGLTQAQALNLSALRL